MRQLNGKIWKLYIYSHEVKKGALSECSKLSEGGQKINFFPMRLVSSDWGAGGCLGWSCTYQLYGT